MAKTGDSSIGDSGGFSRLSELGIPPGGGFRWDIGVGRQHEEWKGLRKLLWEG